MTEPEKRATFGLQDVVSRSGLSRSHRVASGSALRLRVSGEKENCDVGRLSTRNGIICLRKLLCGDGEELRPLLWRPSVCQDNDIKDSPLCCLERRVKPLKFGALKEPHVQDKKLLGFTERGHAESAVLLCVQLWT